MKRSSLFSKEFSHITLGFKQVHANEGTAGQKFILLAIFLKIEVKRIWAQLASFHIGNEKFLDYHIVFPGYNAFAKMFADIFVFKGYAFDGPDNALIIDCGSNIGMSILYFKWSHPNSTIIAFEPDSNTFEYLTRNIEANGLQNVHLNKLALYDREGEITFYSAQQEDADSLLEMSAFQSSLGERPVKSTSIPCARLSSFIDRVTLP